MHRTSPASRTPLARRHPVGVPVPGAWVGKTHGHGLCRVAGSSPSQSARVLLLREGTTGAPTIAGAGGAPPGFAVKTGGLGSAAQALALATLCAVLFLTFLDNTIVSVGLANIQSDLHAGVTSLQWVVNGYALTFASFMLAAGMLGDILGRKRIMLAGVAIFCGGSVMAATAHNVDWL
ncbi:MAG TPA: MFS transporter, partial [Acidimicrobiales bacterium]|nr:MFS transporter [Acidimicrobiales bacterium]